MAERVNSYDPEAIRPVVGTTWVWGHDVIVVTGVYWNGEEWWIESQHSRWADFPARGEGLGIPKRAWNDVGLFWEQARRVNAQPGPGANPKGVTRRGPARKDELSQAPDRGQSVSPKLRS